MAYGVGNVSMPRVLKVGSFSYPPYHVFQRGGVDASIQGVCGEILRAVVTSLCTSYDLIPASDTQWGLRREDGNWTGLIGMVQRDEVDLALSVINPSAEAEKIAFGVQIFVPIELVILAGRASWSNASILDAVRIFSWQVWTCFLGAMFVSAIVIAWSTHVSTLRQQKTRERKTWLRKFYDTFWELTANTFCEANGASYCAASPGGPITAPARLVTGAFWVLVIVMSTSFAGQMKASLMVKKEADRVDSIRDIAKRPWLKPYLPEGSSVVSSIRDSQDPSYHRVWSMAKRHASVLPVRRILTPEAMREAMRSKAVLISSRASHALQAEKACAASDTHGELYVGRTPCYTYNAVMFLSRRLEPRLRNDIKHRVLGLLESGLIQKWWYESSGQWEGCGKAQDGEMLSFENFQGIFLLFCLCLGVATFALLLEWSIYFVCKASAGGNVGA